MITFVRSSGMRTKLLLSLGIVTNLATGHLVGEEAKAASEVKSDNPAVHVQPIALPGASGVSAAAPKEKEIKSEKREVFSAFTGKVTRNKVRLRLEPSLESFVVRELTRGDLLVIVEEREDFYAVQLPIDLKAYIYRTYVLDNVVEGKNVNLRLEPNLDSPIIGSLTTGDRIDGKIAPQNNKWLEVSPPETARLYVAKELVEKVGGPELLVKLQKQKEEVNQLLRDAYTTCDMELQKPFQEVDFDKVKSGFETIISSYKECVDQVCEAKEALAHAQDSFLQKKIDFLETLAQHSSNSLTTENQELTKTLETFQDRLARLQQEIDKDIAPSRPVPEVKVKMIAAQPSQGSASGNAMPAKNHLMEAWANVELNHFASWSQNKESEDIEAFYKEQSTDAKVMTGVLQAFDKPMQRKPGDYILVDAGTKVPLAYLYSTKINLQESVGKEITIQASPRPNYNFAFPAFFVLSVE